MIGKRGTLILKGLLGSLGKVLLLAAVLAGFHELSGGDGQMECRWVRAYSWVQTVGCLVLMQVSFVEPVSEPT